MLGGEEDTRPAVVPRRGVWEDSTRAGRLLLIPEGKKELVVQVSGKGEEAGA